MPDRTAWGAAVGRLVLLTPFAASVMAHAVGPRPSPVPPGPERPSLAFAQYMVDLGTVAPTDQAAVRFRFQNMGTGPVSLQEPKASCGCLQPRLEKTSLRPGEVSEMIVRVRTANTEPGPKEYRIELPYTDSRPHVTRLLFRVTLPPKQVLVRPAALIFYQLSGNPSEQILEVLDQREKPLSVLAANTTSPLADAEVLEPSRNDEGLAVQRVKITIAGEVPPGRHEAVVRILTDDDVYSQLTVPLKIEGRSQTLAETAPRHGPPRR
jgi:hypothetical protein